MKFKVTEDEKIWINSFLKSQHGTINIFDVGANTGDYSSEILRNCTNVQIYAFEPHPLTYKELSLKFQDKKNVNLYNLALGEEDCDLSLFDYDNSFGTAHASLHKDVISSLHQGKVKEYPIRSTKLDNFINSANIDCIDLLKIDTEGHELAVLRGCPIALANSTIRTIHFEFNEMNIISKSTFYEFHELLKNYNLYRILNNGELVHIDKYEPVFCEIYAYQNIVAVLKK